MANDITHEVGTLQSAPNIARLLGEFIAAWGLLEHSLRYILAEVLSINMEASESILYALRNTSARVDIVKDVAKRSEHPRREQIIDLLDQVERLARRRNTLLHQPLGVEQNKKVVRWDFRHPRKTQQRMTSLSEDELFQLILETTDAQALLMHTIDPVGFPQQSWRSKYFQQRAQSAKE